MCVRTFFVVLCDNIVIIHRRNIAVDVYNNYYLLLTVKVVRNLIRKWFEVGKNSKGNSTDNA